VAKQVAFSTRPRSRAADLDAFVHGNAQSQEPAPVSATSPPRMKRLTFDIPAELHMRLKIACAREGKDMAEALRELIAQRWP
jgi:hypothetical protein